MIVKFIPDSTMVGGRNFLELSIQYKFTSP